jgi:hypothetical protein
MPIARSGLAGLHRRREPAQPRPVAPACFRVPGGLGNCPGVGPKMRDCGPDLGHGTVRRSRPGRESEGWRLIHCSKAAQGRSAQPRQIAVRQPPNTWTSSYPPRGTAAASTQRLTPWVTNWVTTERYTDGRAWMPGDRYSSSTCAQQQVGPPCSLPGVILSMYGILLRPLGRCPKGTSRFAIASIASLGRARLRCPFLALWGPPHRTVG